MKGRLDIVKELVSHEANVKHLNKDGWTTVNPEIKKQLLKITDNSGVNLLQSSIISGKEKYKFLYHKDKIGRQAIHYATMVGNLEVLKLLIECGIDVNVVDDWDNWTCLHYACKESYIDIVDYLIYNCKANINIKDKHGRTPKDVGEDNFLSIILKNPSRKIYTYIKFELCPLPLPSIGNLKYGGDIGEVWLGLDVLDMTSKGILFNGDYNKWSYNRKFFSKAISASSFAKQSVKINQSLF
ncbi:10209_t:CDS:2 [Entrophospora sp. SA101]|nr:10209_t:CDS:2 [Entrophospora sp. SA101]